MEYSKDIILGINYAKIKEEGQAKLKKSDKKIIKFAKKHKVIATISILCGILMVLDAVLVYNFMALLQTL